MAELLANSPAERGIAARDGSGRLVGWLGGNASGIFGFTGSMHHALDVSWPDPTGLYGRMYAELATEWRDAGVTVHDVEVPALPAIESAWFDLGFGRRTCFAVRATRDAPVRADFHQRRGPDRRGRRPRRIARLALSEAEARNEPPLFAQQPELRVEDFARAHRDLFRQGRRSLLARRQRPRPRAPYARVHQSGAAADRRRRTVHWPDGRRPRVARNGSRKSSRRCRAPVVSRTRL